MLSSIHKLVLSLIARTMSITRVISITMEMPVAIAMLKNLYPSQVA
jgi:hypothetical protein